MHFDSSRRPEDVPRPSTVDELAARLPVALMTFAPQAALEEAGGGSESSATNGTVTQESVTLSYTLWRNPLDHDDPANLAELPDELQHSLDIEPPFPLPDWLLERRARMRYPSLWEVVRTSRVTGVDPEWHTPELTLVNHVNYVLMNTFREERVRGEFPGELDGEVTESAIEHGVPVRVDGADVPGLRIDTDPHVLGLAVDLGDRILTVALARDHLPYVRLEFATRA